MRVRALVCCLSYMHTSFVSAKRAFSGMFSLGPVGSPRSSGSEAFASAASTNEVYNSSCVYTDVSAYLCICLCISMSIYICRRTDIASHLDGHIMHLDVLTTIQI